MLAALLVPLATPAQAACTYSMNYVQTINAGYSGPIGTLTITMDPVSAKTSYDSSSGIGKYVILSLPSSPSGYVLFPGFAGGAVSGSGTATIDSSGNFSLPVTLISGQLVITLRGSSFTGWNNYTVSAQISGDTYYDSTSPGKYAGTVTVSGTIKDTSGNLMATFSGTVDLTSTTAQSLTLTAASGVTLPTGAAVSASATTNTSITGTNYFDTRNGASFKLERISNTEVKLTVTGLAGSYSDKDDSRILIPLSIKVPTGVTGDIVLTASAPGDSTFSSGSVVIARVGVGKATLAVESVPSISSSGGPIGVIDIKEDAAGALKDSGSTAALKLRLPPGFKWDKDRGFSVNVMWGTLHIPANPRVNPATAPTNQAYFVVTNDDRDLEIHVPAGAASDRDTFFKLSASIKVDESVAKTGEVKVTVSGATTASPSELIVANYGEYGVTVKAYSKTDIIAGKVAQDIGKLEIKEAIPGSLIPGRTITLTLPENVRWSQAPNIDTELSQNYGGIRISDAAVVGSDGRMLKLTFSGSTEGQTDPAKIVLKDMQVTPAADFSGDLKIEVGGSQGVTGTVVLATVKAPVTVSASSTPQVIIGLGGQQVGDITITENMADAIHGTVTGWAKNNDYITSATPTGAPQAKLIIEAPAGVTFDGTPKVEVVEGDLQIDASAVSTDKTPALEGQIIIPIKSSSTTPSKIKISGVKVTLNRTVPEGDLVFKVKGTAVNETLKKWDGSKFVDDNLFEGHNTVAKAAVAKCVTPAPHEVISKAIFKINEAKYTIDGKEYTMDAAPYIDPVTNRAMAPMRYIAYAAGVTPENILWNPETRTATFMKGDRVVQVTADSNILVVNGTQIAMDAKAVIKDGRFFLPVRWLSVALGCQVEWDAQNQQVIVLRNVVQTPGQAQ
nr:stalk domain-containing protein [Ammonifex thiophilus]